MYQGCLKCNFQTALQIPEELVFKDVDGNKYSLKNAHMVQATVPVEQRAKNAIRNLASLKMENYLKVVNLRRINYVFRSSKL
nr:MAG TPA: hypothetical protein [Caudoviricetes sp.]